MSRQLTAHFEGIEPILLEQIDNAERSIHIVMAWLTSQAVKNALLLAKRDDPAMHIEIVVDDNEINDHYFFNYRQEFENAGIALRQKCDQRFLHRKFMVIDGSITVLGSYNYTRKAKYNAENISVIEDQHFSSVHLRIFRALTEPSYRDENVSLLFEHPEFAQRLLSAYYPFSRKQYRKYRSKIILGDCFTHFNGYYDEVAYQPGFIFNPSCRLDRKLRPSEFDLPVTKRTLRNWTHGRNATHIIDSYREYPDQWHEINDALSEVKPNLKRQFKTAISSTRTYEQLKELIKGDIDIIKEDRLWYDNFQPFLNEQVIEGLFVKFPSVSTSYDCDELPRLLLSK
ncbi:phospholipase D-like domain-containing protein [Mucilaginibacter sp. HD30]